MTTYPISRRDVVTLSVDETKTIIEYMYQTNQGSITLLLRNKQYFIELYDGATNQHQEPGYHDGLNVRLLPPAISISGLGS